MRAASGENVEDSADETQLDFFLQKQELGIPHEVSSLSLKESEHNM